MALLLLLTAFVFACVAGWKLGFGWEDANSVPEQMALFLKVIALAVVPYIIAGTFAQIAAIRQRQITLELVARIGAMMADNQESRGKLAREVALSSAAKSSAPQPTAEKPAPAPQSPAPVAGTGPIVQAPVKKD